MPADQARPGGRRSFGLSGIARRAQAAGGQAHLTTQPNQGTRWSIELPLQPTR
jgi:signal transduction histidine kinase